MLNIVNLALAITTFFAMATALSLVAYNYWQDSQIEKKLKSSASEFENAKISIEKDHVQAIEALDKFDKELEKSEKQIVEAVNEFNKKRKEKLSEADHKTKKSEPPKFIDTALSTSIQQKEKDNVPSSESHSDDEDSKSSMSKGINQQGEQSKQSKQNASNLSKVRATSDFDDGSLDLISVEEEEEEEFNEENPQDHNANLSPIQKSSQVEYQKQRGDEKKDGTKLAFNQFGSSSNKTKSEDGNAQGTQDHSTADQLPITNGDEQPWVIKNEDESKKNANATENANNQIEALSHNNQSSRKSNDAENKEEEDRDASIALLALLNEEESQKEQQDLNDSDENDLDDASGIVAAFNNSGDNAEEQQIGFEGNDDNIDGFFQEEEEAEN